MPAPHEQDAASSLTPVLHRECSQQLAICVWVVCPLAWSHASVVQLSLSDAGTTGVKEQPDAGTQESVVHALPSLHAVPFGFTGFEQTPVEGLQTPAS